MNDKMDQSQFPPGWDDERTRRVLAHYETQSEGEALAEDEVAFEQQTDTVIEVPASLLPAIREMIARHRA
ncbi:MAG: hypothetical protein ACREEM_20040 [Blastocatellia bacterium]